MLLASLSQRGLDPELNVEDVSHVNVCAAGAAAGGEPPGGVRRRHHPHPLVRGARRLVQRRHDHGCRRRDPHPPAPHGPRRKRDLLRALQHRRARPSPRSWMAPPGPRLSSTDCGRSRARRTPVSRHSMTTRRRCSAGLPVRRSYARIASRTAPTADSWSSCAPTWIRSTSTCASRSGVRMNRDHLIDAVVEASRIAHNTGLGLFRRRRSCRGGLARAGVSAGDAAGTDRRRRPGRRIRGDRERRGGRRGRPRILWATQAFDGLEEVEALTFTPRSSVPPSRRRSRSPPLSPWSPASVTVSLPCLAGRGIPRRRPQLFIESSFNRCANFRVLC